MDQKNDPKPPQAVNVRGNISPFLQPHEAQALIAAGKNPADYAVIEQAVDQMQIGLGQTTDQKLVAVVQMIVMIPAAVLPLPTSQIVQADGMTGANSKLQHAFTSQAPPQVRIPIRRDALSAEIQAGIADFEQKERVSRLNAFAPPE